MEIKRELAVGELRTPDRALLPGLAAAGGMIVPALVYVALNHGTPAIRGWAIPMATDIAFAIAVVNALKGRLPWALIVFLTALAIFDDMGGILVIALAYGKGIQLYWLAASAGLTLVLYSMGRSHVRSGVAWGLMGALLWFLLHSAGIHATLAGVVLGMMVPARSLHPGRTVLVELHRFVGGLLETPHGENLANEEVLQIEERLEDLEPPLNRYVHLLHPIVAYAIVPLFALSNAGIDLRKIPLSELWAPVPLGITLGLVVGKSLGISSFTWTAVKLGLSPSPGGARAGLVWGVSVVAGIGFTVALFIASLAFSDDPILLAKAKLGILTGSAVSAVFGYLLLRFYSKGTS
jgi:NhaA family Na+:H+ antiporter